jgi:hypothetical protein
VSSAPPVRGPLDEATLPRLGYEELPEALRDQLAAKVTRLGYLGEFFAVAAHQPEALSAFVAFTEALIRALDLRSVNTIALAIATAAGSDYERCQHEQLCVRAGLDEAWIRAAEVGPEAGASPLSTDEEQLRRLALALFERRHDVARGHLEVIIERRGAGFGVAALLLASRYIAHATVTAAIGIASPVPSIFPPAGGDA